MRFLSIGFICVFFFQIADAQLSKVIHQTFEIDSVDKITVNLVGEFELEKWAGNEILTETKIEIYDATAGIFKYFIEEKGRYDIVAEIDGMSASLFSNDSERRTIKNKETDKECYEFIKVRIFVPDDFNIDDPVNLVRMTTSEASANE
jgi:hypothetical protein